MPDGDPRILAFPAGSLPSLRFLASLVAKYMILGDFLVRWAPEKKFSRSFPARQGKIEPVFELAQHQSADAASLVEGRFGQTGSLHPRAVASPIIGGRRPSLARHDDWSGARK